MCVQLNELKPTTTNKGRATHTHTQIERQGKVLTRVVVAVMLVGDNGAIEVVKRAHTHTDAERERGRGRQWILNILYTSIQQTTGKKKTELAKASEEAKTAEVDADARRAHTRARATRARKPKR